MSLLIPLLPVVTEVAAGLTMGITNAVRGEKSGFTLQIGNKVFTNTQSFPFNGLPFEIRSDIMLMALEESKQRNVLPNLHNVPVGHPFRDPNHYLYQHPANPFHPDHVNMAGEMMRNDYPISAWRWTTVSREWWAVLRQQLWSRLVLRGPHAYKGFLRLVADPDSCFVRDFVRTVVLGEGAESTFELYSVIRELPRMDGLIFRPWNPEKNLEPFGIHIVSTDPGPISISFPNIPFDRVTNEPTRKHLLRLPRLARLDLRLDTLSLEIGHLFASLPHLTHLSLRLPSLHPAQLAPLGTAQTAQILGVLMTDEKTGRSDTPEQLDSSRPHLKDLEINAKIIHDDVLPELRAFLAADSRLGPITTIYRGTNRELIYAPEERAALALELSEAAASASSTMGEGTGAPRPASGEEYARGILLRMEGKEGKDSWQRTTSIRLFGGLINLRMESQK